jgi:GNAT superfamily N-acetyltransferase
MIDGVSIQVAEPSDAATISKLCKAHAEFEKASFDSSGHAERLTFLLSAANPKLTVLLAEQTANSAKRAVGYAALTEDISTWKAAPFLHLDCLFVEKEMRGQGLGKAFFEMLKALAAARAIKQIQWHTPEWNQPAIEFYKTLGASSAPKQRFTLTM